MNVLSTNQCSDNVLQSTFIARYLHLYPPLNMMKGNMVIEGKLPLWWKINTCLVKRSQTIFSINKLLGCHFIWDFKLARKHFILWQGKIFRIPGKVFSIYFTFVVKPITRLSQSSSSDWYRAFRLWLGLILINRVEIFRNILVKK